MRVWVLLAAGILTVAALPQARGQDAPVPAVLAGTFVYSETIESGRGRVMAALEPHIAMLPYFVQSMVRSRIEERLGIPRQITIELPGTSPDVRVTYEGERTVTIAAPIGGTTTVTNAEGRTVPVSHRLRLGWLEQEFVGENGTLTVMLSTEPDGLTLHADGTMRGERLSTPVPVRLDYRRAP